MPVSNASSSSNASWRSFQDADLKIYLEIGRRRKWWIILTTLGVFICTLVLTKRMPNIYRAETVILVDSQQVPDKYVPDITTGDIAGRLTTLQQQVLSPTRLKALVESEGLYPDSSGKLSEKQVIKSVQKSITVELVNPGAGKMGSFRIAYSGKNRLRVAPVANQLAQMFIDENTNAREEQTADTADFLESQLAVMKQQLDEKDGGLRAIKTRNIMDLPESKPYHLEALANLRGQVEAIQNKIQEDRSQKSILQSMLVSGTGAPTVDADGQETGGGGGGGGPYQAELQKLQAKLTELRSRYGPGHPDVRRTQASIDELKAKMSAAPDTTSAAAQSADAYKPAIQQSGVRHNPVLEAQIEQLDEDIQNQTRALAPLQQQIDFHTSKLEQLPVFEQQIERLQQDYDILKGQYKDLQDKEEAAKISHALEVRQKGDRFVILDSAVTPESPASPNRTLISLGGLIGGMFAGFLLAIITEIRDESVRNEREVMRIFSRPILTEIPRVTSELERRSQRLRAIGMLTATAVGSVAVGLLLSVVTGTLF